MFGSCIMQFMSVKPSVRKSEKVKLRAWKRQGQLPSEVLPAYDSAGQLWSCSWGRHPGQM